VVDALTRIHAALVPGGTLVDTQPVGLRLPVALDGEPIGELEDDEWLETVAAVGAEVDKTLAAGLFELCHEEHYTVVHEFGSGRECVDVVAGWAGTNVPEDVAARLARGKMRTTVEQGTRLRLLDRRQEGESRL
jgi:hypothetical protein